ncbi:RHS repeat-associated core domain-containing protein [Streptomyces sioyaensis]|uniref:RHS repeat-associated core domain-containing protein n=1 Tax=Streptomyces sioyaensis TaxID=67364 RepID=UPI0037B91F0C
MRASGRRLRAVGRDAARPLPPAADSRHQPGDAAGGVHAHNWSEAYAYDDAGNQTHADWPAKHPGSEARGPRTYTGNRITGAGQIRYEHDAQGRITRRQKTRLSRSPDTWHYTWDAEDRLTSVTTPDGQLWRYLYDPLGRRIAKRRVAADGTILEQIDFTWDGSNLVEQTTNAVDLPCATALTWEHDGLQPIAQTERKSAVDASQQEVDQRFFAIVTDLVGAPTELLDEVGNITWRTRTTLWGATAWAATSTAYTPLRFPGQYFDPETGFHYSVHRYYDPETARYTAPG